MPADEAFYLATEGSASLFGLNMGKIEVGKSADLLLIDLNNIQLIPNHHLISNLVYSAQSGCINTTIAKGEILMENRCVKDEKNVIDHFQKVIRKQIGRASCRERV